MKGRQEVSGPPAAVFDCEYVANRARAEADALITCISALQKLKPAQRERVLTFVWEALELPSEGEK